MNIATVPVSEIKRDRRADGDELDTVEPRGRQPGRDLRHEAEQQHADDRSDGEDQTHEAHIPKASMKRTINTTLVRIKSTDTL